MGLGQRTYSAREQAAIIEAIERSADLGKSVSATAREFGITGSIYYRWIRERARIQTGCEISVRQSDIRSPRGRYSREEKAALVAEIERRREAGQTVRAATLALGLPEHSFYQWLQEVGVPKFRPVEIVVSPATAPQPLSLIAPSGYRIEGLDVVTAAQLLRALG